jgi:hypothetical protein
MNSKVINFNNILIVINWFTTDLKAYVSYHKEYTQVTDWNIFTQMEKEIIATIIDNVCESENLLKWSY